MSAGPQIVVSGYYGFGNAGDEAVLAATADIIRRAVPDARLSVASGDPEGTQRLHGLDAFDRFRWQEFRGHVRACDLFVSGGGSLLQDVTSRRSIYYYLGTLAMATLYRRSVMVFGQGIGPIQAPAARAVTAALLNRVRLITVRDPDSLETLKALGVCHPPVHLTADPVFALEPAPRDKARAILQREGVDLEAPRVGFALRVWPPRPDLVDLRRRALPPDPGAKQGAALIAATARAAEAVYRELRAQPVFIPLHPPADREFARAVADCAGVPCIVLDGGYGPRQVHALFGEMDLVVAMRLHALIFAAVHGVVPVGIAYDPKIPGFLRSLGRTPAAEVTSITMEDEALVAAILHAWRARHDEALSLRRMASGLREKALENGALLASLLPSRMNS